MGQDVSSLYGQSIPSFGPVPHFSNFNSQSFNSDSVNSDSSNRSGSFSSVNFHAILPQLSKIQISKIAKILPNWKWKEDGFDLDLRRWLHVDSLGKDKTDDDDEDNDDEEEDGLGDGEEEEEILEPYERYRTQIGSPSITRQSFTQEEIEAFERENDGFPLPCTEDELKAFDSEVFTKEVSKAQKRSKKRDRQRSKSATAIPDLATIRLKLQKLQSPGKPKFLEHLINRVVSKKVGKRDNNAPGKPKFLEHLINRVVSKKVGKRDNNGLILKPEDAPREQEELLSPDSEKCLQQAECIVEELLQQQSTSKRPTSGESTDSGKGSLLESTSDFSPTQKRPPWSTPTSPTFQGIVKQRLRGFQALQENQASPSNVSSPSSSIPSSPKLGKPFQDKDRDKANAEQFAEVNKNIRKFCSAIAEDESFNSAVMESGYVKNLVSKINSHKYKPPSEEGGDEDNTLEDNNSDGCSQSSSILGASSKSPSKDEDSGWEEWCKEGGDSEAGEEAGEPATHAQEPATNGVDANGLDSIDSPTPIASPSASTRSSLHSNTNSNSNSVTSSRPNSSEAESQEEEDNEKPKDKLHQIAYELLTTERAYVARLQLLDEVFHFRVMVENKNANLVPDEAVSQMFANIKPIYQFHKDFLLQQLEARMKKWSTEQKIGDIIVKLAPFLKLYTEYVKNFNNAMGLIDKWSKQSPKFAFLLDSIQKQPECGQLTLQHHMLEPIQRVPRYEMLLKDYLKRLAHDSPDRPDTEKALELVTEAANHANRAMKKIEIFIKVLNILKHLSGEGLEDLVSPTRELLKEGPITKISARSSEKQARYLFLFNDLLLVCVEQGVLGPYKYKVRYRLSVNGMEIVPSGNMNIQNTFCVKSVEKTVEFLDETNNGHGADWLAAFEQVITDYQNKIALCPKHSTEGEESSEPCLLGQKAPKWDPDSAVSMCRSCQDKFTAMRRRHHCRACGLIFCGRCSSKRAPLEYDKNRMNRVCEKCYQSLVQREEEPTTPTTPQPVGGVDQVEADRVGVLSGYLNMMDKGRTWCRRWITVHPDFVMYFYKKHKDVKALQTLPLPGHTVKMVKDSAKPNVFALMHKEIYVCYFEAEDEEQFQEWVNVLEKLSRLELPTEDDTRVSKRLSSHSTGSSHSGSSGQSSQS